MQNNKRTPFLTRSIRLVGEVQRRTAMELLEKVPLDSSKPLELLVREEVKARKLDQNALMWVGPLSDIAEQAYVDGRKFSPEVWHEYFKQLYLPEEFDAELVKSESYKKYDFTPGGERVLVGSTTDLTIRGFALYLQQVEAHGANLGVLYHANPRERAA